MNNKLFISLFMGLPIITWATPHHSLMTIDNKTKEYWGCAQEAPTSSNSKATLLPSPSNAIEWPNIMDKQIYSCSLLAAFPQNLTTISFSIHKTSKYFKFELLKNTGPGNYTYCIKPKNKNGLPNYFITFYHNHDVPDHLDCKTPSKLISH